MNHLTFYVNIFESNTKDGPMSTKKSFYPDSWDQEKIKEDLLKRRIKLGKRCGFDGKKMIIPSQKNHTCKYLYPDGLSTIITEELIKQKEDLWNLDILTDILLLSQNTKGIVMGFPAADCPVLIIEDTKNKVSALSHCGGEYINRELPVDTIKRLEEYTNGKRKDFLVYISSCASFDHYCYDRYPKWATNSIWKDHIQKREQNYHIDLRSTLIDLFQKNNIALKQLLISQKDTITNPLLYSNSAAFHQVPGKNGRHLIGCFYPTEKEKTYSLFHKEN